jgi:hypothetical protein
MGWGVLGLRTVRCQKRSQRLRECLWIEWKRKAEAERRMEPMKALPMYYAICLEIVCFNYREIANNCYAGI